MVTIYDLARITGYSPATVSKVLNNYKGVSVKAQNAVNKAIKELNYVPNGSARGLMLKRSYTIALILQDDGNGGLLHSHFSKIVESFRKYVTSYGYDIIIIGGSVGGKELTLKEHCQYRGVDGVLIAVGKDIDINNEINDLIESDIPIISVETKYKNKSIVISENYKSTKMLLEYVYFNGHRKIGMVYVKGDFLASKTRYNSYIDFCKSKKIKIKENFIKCVDSFTYESGEKAALEYINNKQIPTAIFCLSDEIAFGMIDTFRSNGVNVPCDISVVGFDDLTRAKYEGLTTIRQDREKIGVLAAKKLLNIIENDDEYIEDLEISSELVIRNSCKKIN